VKVGDTAKKGPFEDARADLFFERKPVK